MSPTIEQPWQLVANRGQGAPATIGCLRRGAR
jgi:hypothetical protein